jgi:hypothetical protein
MSNRPPPNLKTCPLDGEPVRLYHIGGWNIIRCDHCGLKLEKHLDRDTVVRMWNSRKGQQELFDADSNQTES